VHIPFDGFRNLWDPMTVTFVLVLVHCGFAEQWYLSDTLTSTD